MHGMTTQNNLQHFSCVSMKWLYIHRMTTEDLAALKLRVEWAGMMYRWALAVRCNKKRPDLAALASVKEMEWKREFERLEQELGVATGEELALAVNGHPREEAA